MAYKSEDEFLLSESLKCVNLLLTTARLYNMQDEDVSNIEKLRYNIMKRLAFYGLEEDSNTDSNKQRN